MLEPSEKIAVIHTSAPGKLMLLGEHAVLSGGQSIVAAINRRLNVYVKARHDNKIVIKSSQANHVMSINNINTHAELKLLCSIISLFAKDFKLGFDITIVSEFSAELGLGSSAAVCVAGFAAIYKFVYGRAASQREIFNAVLPVCRTSGADVAASVHGGLIAYRAQPLQISVMPITINLEAVYSGSKDKTENVVSDVKLMQRDYPELYESYFGAINTIVEKAVIALLDHDLNTFAACVQGNQDIMEKMNLSSVNLDAIYKILSSISEIYAVKISGSGRGDCMWGLGKLKPDSLISLAKKLKNIKNSQYLSLNIDPKGVTYHDQSRSTIESCISHASEECGA